MPVTRVLLFDFDGIVIDTESAAFRAWEEMYEEHGQTLLLDDWSGCLGTVGGFDPLGRLQELTGPLEDPAALDQRRWERKLELLENEMLRPGIDAFLERARELQLLVAIVSSDTDEWISMNLSRVGRTEGWALIHCANGDVNRAKPLPCLYEEALAHLGAAPDEAIAFEDSPNGIRAAKAAGLYCVVVPNPITRSLDLTGGDLYLDSFEDTSLDDVIATAKRIPDTRQVERPDG